MGCDNLHPSASEGGGLAAFLNGGGDVLLTISNCLFTHEMAKAQGGGVSAACHC